jgi:hypothetical protein
VGITVAPYYLFTIKSPKMEPNRELRLAIFLCVIAAIAIALTALYFKRRRIYKLQLEEMKDEYHEAIRKGDKREALELGRKYYSALRGGFLSIYDEQAIANDLSSIA